MPDDDRLDRLLVEAGERWRAGQSRAPRLADVWRAPTHRSGLRLTSLLLAVGLVVLLGVAALGPGGSPAPSTSVVRPSPSPSVPTSCFVTLRSDAGAGPLASQLASMSLPGSLVPYGQPALWATIPRSGSWPSSTSTSGGRFIRTFWYSDRWSITDEPSPSISVSAGRFGGGQSVTGSAAVSARSRELGTSMIVSLDLPSGGCWQITGTYRDQSLSYVVWIDRDQASPILSGSTTLPSELDGVPVTTTTDAPAVLAATSPGESILVGGFLRPPVVMFCPMMQTFPDIWNVCSAVRVYPDPWVGDVLPVYLGASNVSLPTIPDGQVEPVVLRVHSRDAGCPSTYDCASLPVLDGLAWIGRLGPPPAPTNTAPPDGISQADAIRDAIGISFNNGGSLDPQVVSAVAGPYAVVQSEGGATIPGDRWVWLVTLRVQVTAPDCPAGNPCPIEWATRAVILDYVEGSFVIMSTSTGSSPAPS
ncbi:MAG: hypothetical protein HY263_08135 [Chloroflexi bacterium]|nr:hypothetical protein [Chloroflexota bacterium]